MDTNYDEQFLVIAATIESKKPAAAEKQTKTDEKLTLLTENLQVLTAFMMDQTNISKSSPDQKDASTPPEHTTVVPNNSRDPPLEGGNSTKIGGMWTLKHEISSQTLYELLIKTELKGDTILDLNNFFNHVKMSLNAVTRLREYLLPDYLSIKIKSDFEEYFVPDCDHPSYSWDVQIYTSLGHYY